MELKDVSALIKSPLEKVLSFVGTELKQAFSNRIIEYQTEEYARNYYSKTLLHRAEPKKLDDFYIPLKILKSEKDRYHEKKTATDSCKRLFSKNKYITLIGTAGSGKSTLVKYLFTNCINEGFKIPIKV
jgi:polynucleotide 5'-kinase involved in rRNA processing